MFDWNEVGEVRRNAAWGELNEAEDHIVPYPKTNKDDNLHLIDKHHKRQRHEHTTSSLNIAEEQKSESKNDFRSSNSNSNSNFNANEDLYAPRFDMDPWPDLPSLNSAFGKGYMVGNHLHSVTSEFIDGCGASPGMDRMTENLVTELCDADGVIQNRDLSFKESCTLPASRLMQLDTGPDMFGKYHGDEEGGSFLNCDWGNIADFDDLDRIFRNNGSTFGHDIFGNEDELLSPSTDSISAMASPFSVPVHEQSGGGRKPLHEDKMADNIAAITGQIEQHSHLCNTNCEVHGHIAAKAYRGKKLPKSRKKLENNRSKFSQDESSWPSNMCRIQQPESTKMQVPPISPQSFQSSAFVQQTEGPPIYSGFFHCASQTWLPSYRYPAHSFPMVPMLSPPHPERKENHPLSPSSIARPESSKHTSEVQPKSLTMTPQEKIEKLKRLQKMQAMLAIQQQQQQFGKQSTSNEMFVSQTSSSMNRNRSVVVSSDKADGAMETMTYLDSNMSQGVDEPHKFSALIDDSLGESIFCQLQDAIGKLDIGIRLCIRDSFFRLARSALERHNAGDSSSTNKDSREEVTALINEDAIIHDRTTGLPTETGTNPIDRTLAHLLFCEAREPGASVKSEVPQSSSNPAKKRKRVNVNPLLSRCSMNVYIRDRDKMGFRECHKVIMRSTPFRPYIDNIETRPFNINFVEEIILAWRGTNLFRLGKVDIPFTCDDVALILGVPSVGRTVPISGRAQKSHLLHCYPKDTSFERKNLRELIKLKVKSDKYEDVEDTVRLWILLLLSTFLAPRTNYTCAPQMFHCLDNLKNIGEYAWASAFRDQILVKLAGVVDAARNKKKGQKMLAEEKTRNVKVPVRNRFIYGCSTALCVWFLEHTRVQSAITKLAYPRLFRWESGKKKKVQVNISTLKAHEIVPQLSFEEEEKWLLQGMMASTQKMNEREEEAEMKEKGETSTSSLVDKLSLLGGELATLTARAAEREEQTRLELNEFRGKLDSLVCELRVFLGKDSNDDKPCGESDLDRLVEVASAEADKHEKKISSITRRVKRRGDRQPSAYAMSPFEIILPVKKGKKNMKNAVKTGKGKEHEAIFVAEEQITPLPIEKVFIENRRDFVGAQLLDKEDVLIVETFFCSPIDSTVVVEDQWKGYVTRKHVHEIIFGEYIVDAAIDIGVDFLLKKTSEAPDLHYLWGYMPTLVLHNLLNKKNLDDETAQQLTIYLSDVDKLDQLFFVLFTHNHWHLLMVNVKKKCATSYNSLKGNKLHNAAAKKLVKLLNQFFSASGLIEEPLILSFDKECPTQPPESGNCALYVLKYIEALSKKEELTWNFGEEDMDLFRAQYAVHLLRSTSGC